MIERIELNEYCISCGCVPQHTIVAFLKTNYGFKWFSIGVCSKHSQLSDYAIQNIIGLPVINLNNLKHEKT